MSLEVCVLGEKYKIETHGQEDPKLKDAGGYCDPSIRAIVIAKVKPDINNCADMDEITKRVMRHEILHAFVFESGLDSNSEWALNEEMTAWVANQFPKMLAAFEHAGAI